MAKKNYTERILFSPIGNTDPVRDFFDGGCLHIVRHYHPDKVLLFFTKDEGKKEPIMVEAIKNVYNNCEILPSIKTAIVKPHLYDEFKKAFPEAINKLHEQYPEAEILLNLSSGTPAMKGILAILSVETDYCLGIQVESTRKSSNIDNPAVKTIDDMLDMLKNNFDDLPEASNRCTEPELQIVRYYSEKNRILALIDHYEYHSAWYLARNSDNIPESVKLLLEHAAWRMKLLPDKAKKVMSSYEGKKLFPFDDKTVKLVEYFQLIQIAQKENALSEVLLKSIPFMYELLLYYLKSQSSNLPSSVSSLWKTKWMERKQLSSVRPDFLKFLDNEFGHFRDSELSFRLLEQLCIFIKAAKLLPETETGRHNAILRKIEKVNKTNGLRNEAAHIICNIQEEEFRERTGMGSGELVGNFYQLLQLIVDQKRIKNFGYIYDRINLWISQELLKSESNLE